MTYDSLMLSYGGGIIGSSKRSAQYQGAAAVAIGIGGTGVAALAELKRKVYQQLLPDNPGEPIPHYDHIQFLAIDSDETDIDAMRGNARLDKSSEFFSIHNPHLAAMLGGAGKRDIKRNPVFNWMDIDSIDALLSPQGAGGVRQVGRYLLLSKAAELKTQIEAKCLAALRGLVNPSLDIYIFAGISGGTGSGCFLDTCYIVRKALEDRGWAAMGNIMGFFFLPDVVTSKSEVAADPAKVAYNDSNGYAAMKELDYLMDMKSNGDRFFQNYGAFTVDTQEAPVHMCHLISATKSNGAVLHNGFLYGIHVASDYVMAYLADVDLGNAGANPNNGLTMKGHLSNVTQGVNNLHQQHGANRSYHVLGAANAEIPMTQIATYLAAGFYRRFQECAGRDKAVITKSVVNEWVMKLGLTADGVYSDLVQECPALFLPQIDRNALKAYGVMPKGKVPQPWAEPGNAWLDACSGKRTGNRAGLNREMSTYDYEKVPNDSLVGKVFRKLYELSIDSNYGPYYAAGLLNHSGYDLISAVEGCIREAEEQASTQKLQLYGNGSGGWAEEVVQRSADFCNHPNNKKYQSFYDSVQQWYLISNRLQECNDLAITLRGLKTSLEKLYNAFFVPLLSLLDGLKDTFREDIQYLDSDAAKAPTAYTWRILELEDVRLKLDLAVDALQPNELVNKFMTNILNNYEEWWTGDDGKIGQFISRYMETVFNVEINRSLQDRLFDIYPQAGRDVNLLAQEIQRDIIQKIHNSALPMFWCSPLFNINDTFQSSSLSVPLAAIAVCNAADNFQRAHNEYVVRKTGLQDRIFALRFFSGVPFYAYQGITLLKADYDKAAAGPSGVGSHLYSKTNRGNDGTGDKDWRNFLPVPAPFSKAPDLVPDAAGNLALYDKGVEAGIIVKNAQNNYVIRQTPELIVPTYQANNFVIDGVFQAGKLNSAREELRAKLDGLHAPGNGVQEIPLKNDGYANLGEEVVTQVRKDYFLHFTVLQRIVQNELDKCAALESGIAALDAIEKAQTLYDADRAAYCEMIFYGILPCTDGSGDPSYFIDEGKFCRSKISHIVHHYESAYGAAEQVFSQNSKDMPYANNYPLYQGFLTYRSLPADQQPRQGLDEALEQRRKALLGKGDNIIGHCLEDEWDSKALGKLAKDVDHMVDQEKQELLRFYLGLSKSIAAFHDKFSNKAWNYTGEDGSQPTPPPPAEPRVWTLWDGARYLYLYEQYLSYGAYDSTTGQYVPVTAGMQVHNPATGGWQNVMDAAGNLQLP